MNKYLLSQFELAQSVKKRYDALAEDLVGEDESVECPECGKECEGRESIKQHIARSDDHPPLNDSLDGRVVSPDKIFEDIAEGSSFDLETVRRLISVANIPEQFHTFVKIPNIDHRYFSHKI